MPSKNTAGKKMAAAGPTNTAGHATYQDMIKDAILNLKERNGSSRQAIKKYIIANNNLDGTTDAAFTSHLSRALVKGEEQGEFLRPKGPSGPIKIAKKINVVPKISPPVKTSKTITKKPASKAVVSKKEKSPPVPKRSSSKSAAASSGGKMTSRSGSSRPRKSAPALAPAVETNPPMILSKTKSGRVTKVKAPPPGAGPLKTKKKNVSMGGMSVRRTNVRVAA